MFRTHNSRKIPLTLNTCQERNQTSLASSLLWKVWEGHPPLLKGRASNPMASGPSRPAPCTDTGSRGEELRWKGGLSACEKVLESVSQHVSASILDLASPRVGPQPLPRAAYSLLWGRSATCLPPSIPSPSVPRLPLLPSSSWALF